MHLGFIGLGKMGKPMTRNLLQAGFTVTVHNRSRAVVDLLASEGATPASSSAEVARAADLLFTCLPTAETVEEVFLGSDGVIGAARAGQILIDCSTVTPELSRRIYAAAAEAGASFLDAPVSGGPAGAEEASLTIMVGGDAGVLARARPALQALGPNIHHVGPSGSGTVVKIVNQLLVAINMAAVAEATALGVKAGASPEALLEVIQSSFGGSRMLTRALPLMMDRNFAAATTINILLKDLGLIHEVSQEMNARLLLGAVAQEVFKEGRALGYGDEDIAALIKPAERITGVEVRRS